MRRSASTWTAHRPATWPKSTAPQRVSNWSVDAPCTMPGAPLSARRSAANAQRAAHEQARREHDEARRAQAAQEQARRESDGLLRAYESSTLTRANFCALKGIAEADLEALLAQARLAPRAPPLPSPPQTFDRGARPPSARPPRQRPAHPGKPAR